MQIPVGGDAFIAPKRFPLQYAFRQEQAPALQRAFLQFVGVDALINPKYYFLNYILIRDDVGIVPYKKRYTFTKNRSKQITVLNCNGVCILSEQEKQ